MKIKHYICPRSCGKTTFAENLQMEDPENTLLFKIDGGLWKWGQNMRGEKWKRIIMDEYIFRYNQLTPIDKRKFIDWIHNVVLSTLDLVEGELILLSTSDRQYSSELILLAMMSSYNSIPDSIIVNIDKINEKISEVKNKFLIPSPRVIEVIKWNDKLFGRNLPDIERVRLKSLFSKEEYEVNFENNFIV